MYCIVVTGISAFGKIMYYFAEQLMKLNMPFILENNFENISKQGIIEILNKYGYTPITLCLTGDYKILYERFKERNQSPDRHRGHVVNDCYPERAGREVGNKTQYTYDEYVNSTKERGMDTFKLDGPNITIDTTYFKNVNFVDIINRIKELISRY